MGRKRKTAVGGIQRTDGFRRKRLGEFKVDFGLSCSVGCRYCYVPAVLSRHPLSERIAKREVIVRPEILPKVLEDARRTNERGTVIFSTLVDPFMPETIHEVREAMCAVLKEGWTVRIITKLTAIREELAWLAHFKDRVQIGISCGCTDAAYCAAVEPNAPSPEARIGLMHDLLESGFRLYVMACPIPAFSIRRTFKRYADEGLILAAEEVFCEIVNPRSTSYESAADALDTAGLSEYAEDLRKMRDPAHRSSVARNLAKFALEYVPPEKLRVLTYETEVNEHDRKVMDRLPAVVWL